MSEILIFVCEFDKADIWAINISNEIKKARGAWNLLI